MPATKATMKAVATMLGVGQAICSTETLGTEVSIKVHESGHA